MSSLLFFRYQYMYICNIVLFFLQNLVFLFLKSQNVLFQLPLLGNSLFFLSNIINQEIKHRIHFLFQNKTVLRLLKHCDSKNGKTKQVSWFLSALFFSIFSLSVALLYLSIIQPSYRYV